METSTSSQIKQFALSTAFMFVAVLGITVSKSFDSSYLIQAEVKKNKAKTETVALQEKELKEKAAKTKQALN